MSEPLTPQEKQALKERILKELREQAERDKKRKEQGK